MTTKLACSRGEKGAAETTKLERRRDEREAQYRQRNWRGGETGAERYTGYWRRGDDSNREIKFITNCVPQLVHRGSMYSDLPAEVQCLVDGPGLTVTV